MVRLPIQVDSSVFQPMLLSMLRMGLVALGASLQANGWLPADTNLDPIVTQIAGQIMILIAVIWQGKRVITNTAEKKIMEAALPNDIAVRKDAPASNAVLKSPGTAFFLLLISVLALTLSGCAGLGAVGRLGAVRTVGVHSPSVCAAEAARLNGSATAEDIALLAIFDKAALEAAKSLTAVTNQPSRIILECV